MAINPGDRRAWVATLYLEWIADVFGAVRSSRRLHWTHQAALAEAEGWVAKMEVEPITWRTIDDQTIIGRNRTHAVVIWSILLPRDHSQA